VVEEKLLDARKPVTVGHDPRSRVFAPFRAVPRCLPLFDHHNGQLWLLGAADHVGFVSDEDGARSLGACVGSSLALKPGARGRVAVGDAMVLFEVRPAPPSQGLVRKLGVTLAVLVALAQVALLGWALTPSPAVHAESGASIVAPAPTATPTTPTSAAPAPPTAPVEPLLGS